MTKDYFKKLKKLKNDAINGKKSFAGELFANTDYSLWAGPNEGSEAETGNLSEKSLLMDSLAHYVNEEVENKPDQVIPVPGGEITKRKQVINTFSEQIAQKFSAEDLRLFCNNLLGSGADKRRYVGDLRANIDILFVTDTFFSKAEELEVELSYLKEIVPSYFRNEVGLLFSNIAKAMQRPAHAIGLSSLQAAEEELNLEELFYHELAFFNPGIIISLGAKTTEVLLGERKRIADVHGQVYQRVLKTDQGEVPYKVMPLFHPEFLSVNPNMKKAAWLDLQKAMSLL